MAPVIALAALHGEVFLVGGRLLTLETHCGQGLSGR